LQPHLPDPDGAEADIGRRHDRLLGPAVLPGQLDRLREPLRGQPERPEARRPAPVRQAVDLEPGPPDPVRQGAPLLQVPFGISGPKHPQFGAAEADQRQRVQVLVQPVRCGAGRLRGWQQPLCLLGDGRKVTASLRQGQPHDGEVDLEPFAAVRGHRRHLSLRAGQVALR
jgi:hypothetical protein